MVDLWRSKFDFDKTNILFLPKINMFVESSSKLHDWPLTFGRVYLVFQKFDISDGFIYLIMDDKFVLRPYHSKLFSEVK